MDNKRFAVFLIFFMSISLAASVWIVKNGRFDLRKKAAEEKESIPVSRWVPIKIDEMDQVINEQVDVITSEESSVSNDSIQKKQIDRSLKIKDVIKRDLASMDTKKDNEIDYKEFNKNIISLSDKVYSLRHSLDETKEKGIYSVSSMTGKQKKILRIIVEAGIYKDLKSSLKTYVDDIAKDNPDYQVKIYQCNGCSKEEIKSILKEKGTIGAVFVGDLPSAWYYTNGCFGWSGQVEVFPTDLYYMDLNGIWGGEISGYEERPFSSHTGNVQPEIFVARLTTPVESQEVNLLKMYFKKNHKFRNFGNNISRKSLNYIDNDWSYFAQEWGQQTGLAYPDSTVVNDINTTNGVDYKNRWRSGYEHVLVAVHSNYYEHFFSPALDNGRVSWVEVKEEKPAANFYNLFACSNALYTVENYMAGWYIFQDSDYGLTAVGSTKTGSMLFFDKFYQSLSMRNNFGAAFKDWLSGENVYSDKCWFGGMVMIGDPTLKSTATCTESNWKSTVSPKTCPSSGKQTRTWTKVGNCADGVVHTTEIINCKYTGRDSACIKKKGTCKVWESSKVGALCNNGTGRIEANLCLSKSSTKYRCCVPIKQ